MFILAAKPTVLWPVTYRTPNDEGGFDDHTFKARFNLPQDQAEVENLFRQIDMGRQKLLQLITQRDKADAEIDLSASDRAILEKYWAGWPDGEIKDAQGAVISYSPDSRQSLLALPGMRVALVRAFMETLGGNAEVKNSKPLLSTG